MLTTLDYHSFVQVCAAWNDFELACELIEQEGQILEDAHGKKYKNPRINARSEAFAILRTMAPSFGLTPSDRTRFECEKQMDEFTREFLT